MLREKNIFLVRIAVVMKLARLGLDCKICYKCGRVFLTTKRQTLCKHCQTL